MPWPAKVAKPSDEPEAFRKPLGNGLSSLAAGVAELSFVPTMVVVWLNPSWLVLGLVEYLPFTSMVEITTGATNMPKPPRMTVLPWRKSGVQAKPTRGLTRWESFLLTAVWPAAGK